MIDIEKTAEELVKKTYSSQYDEILGEEVFHHSKRVCHISLLIAEEYGFDLQKKIDIAMGALLHDVGKSYVNPNILYKADKLTKDDRMIIECHPQLGYIVLKNLGFNDNVTDIVHYHHERLDASGYPERLSGNKINICTQIVSIADVFDALTTKRVYHQKRSVDQAFEIMKQQKGLNQIAISILEEIMYKQKKCK